MTQDEIIAMALEAGFENPMPLKSGGSVVLPWPIFERFHSLAAAAEREEANRRSNAAWSLMCEKMVSAERAAFIAKIQAEIDHAHINNLRLTPPFGRMNGEVAVRASDLDAALDAIRARGNHASS